MTFFRSESRRVIDLLINNQHAPRLRISPLHLHLTFTSQSYTYNSTILSRAPSLNISTTLPLLPRSSAFTILPLLPLSNIFIILSRPARNYANV
jgi:hypothetical protein